MKKFFTLFLIALMGIGSVWAQTYDGGLGIRFCRIKSSTKEVLVH